MRDWLIQFRMLRRKLVAPAAIFGAAFLAMLLFSGDPENRLMLYRIYLGLLPMLTAMLAPGLMLDDPALEVTLTAPRRPIRWVFQRLTALWLLAALSSLMLWPIMAYVGPAIEYPPGWATLLPSVALSALALLAGLIGTESIIGLTVGGATWFIQLVLHGLLLATPKTWPLAIFLGLHVGAPLTNQQLTMAAIALVALALSAWLLRREERYL